MGEGKLMTQRDAPGLQPAGGGGQRPSKPRSASAELRLARRAYENAQHRLRAARRDLAFAAERLSRAEVAALTTEGSKKKPASRSDEVTGHE